MKKKLGMGHMEIVTGEETIGNRGPNMIEDNDYTNTNRDSNI